MPAKIGPAGVTDLCLGRRRSDVYQSSSPLCSPSFPDKSLLAGAARTTSTAAGAAAAALFVILSNGSLLPLGGCS